MGDAAPDVEDGVPGDDLEARGAGQGAAGADQGSRGAGQEAPGAGDAAPGVEGAAPGVDPDQPTPAGKATPVPPVPPPPPPPSPRTGISALTLPYQVGVALVVAVVGVAVCVHVGMVFLHVAPSNTVTKQHGEAIDDWIYPEFEQNWKLFAPNPLQQNVSVQVRAQIRTPDGSERTTDWYDLSAADGRAIDGNPLPSHTDQNALRRAWDFYVATHDGDNRSTGPRGTLAETYVRRLVVLRLERTGATGEQGVVERVQVRSGTTTVRPPQWSEEQISLDPVYRTLPWWQVPAAGAGAGTGAQGDAG
ncbi:DUF5819 family protein [Streptomyces sp. NPDC056716]|uniref:DUF5819 family protein n=1 Tax=unclassified Streptomyces TaxID=2593676 RepID=UPI0036D07D72